MRNDSVMECGDGGATAVADTQSAYDVRVTSRRYLSEDIIQLEFEGVHQCPLPDYEPGSHIDIHVKNELVRQYSLIKVTRTQASYRVAFKVKRGQGSATEIMSDLLRVGATTKISAPRNAFPLDLQASETILICGGIGITPLIHMAMTLDVDGRRWSMHVASRDGSELALLEQLGDRREVNKYISTEGRRLSIQEVVAQAPLGAHLYCCGSDRMLQDYLVATKHRPPETVHYEQFHATPSSGNEFTVILARSGKRYIVRQHETILDVVRNAGHQVAASCRQGVCGACETKLISGVPEHKDRLLSDDEKASGQTILICCSRGLSPELTLDL